LSSQPDSSYSSIQLVHRSLSQSVPSRQCMRHIIWRSTTVSQRDLPTFQCNSGPCRTRPKNGSLKDGTTSLIRSRTTWIKDIEPATVPLGSVDDGWRAEISQCSRSVVEAIEPVTCISWLRVEMSPQHQGFGFRCSHAYNRVVYVPGSLCFWCPVRILGTSHTLFVHKDATTPHHCRCCAQAQSVCESMAQ